jgi:hypothetical protein
MRIIMLVFTVSLAVAQTSPPALAPSTVAVSKFPSVSTDRDWVDYGLLVFNFGLVLIGFFGVRAAVRTLRAIQKQAALTETQIQDARTSSENSAKDVQASIAEAVRSARAMEAVAESMASNVKSVQQSIAISRQIADTQKLATILQSRAYLSVFFNTAVFQDANRIFEASAVLKNHGNTPAYDVTFSAVSEIVSLPLPDDFAFQLPDTAAGRSVSFMAPGTTKLIQRRVSGRVLDDQVETIKGGGGPQCLAMWGVVNYRDAFNEARYVKFAFTIDWIPWLPGQEPKDKDGNPLPRQIFSHDTAGNNDAN